MNGIIKRHRISWILIIALAGATCVLFFFDQTLSRLASPELKMVWGDETTRLGAVLQLVRPFGLTDIVLLVALIFGLAGQRRYFKQIILAVICVAIIIPSLKAIAGRERPSHGSITSSYSFPSGDTSTAFVLPEIFAAGGNPVLHTGATVIAIGVGCSRVFYGAHFPSDVFFGAACGLFAGIMGLWLARKIKWVPGERFIIFYGFLLLAFMLISTTFDSFGIAKMQHRHMVQFFAWYGPAAIFYIAHKRLRAVYGKRVRLSKYRFNGQLYSMFKRALVFCGIFGIVLLFAPWLIGVDQIATLEMLKSDLLSNFAKAAYNPAVSAGLLLLVFSWYATKNLNAGRLGALAADFATMLYLVQIYGALYIFGIL